MKSVRPFRPLAALAALFALALPAGARVLSQEEIETAAANFLVFDDLGSQLLPGRTVASVKPRDSLWIVDLDPAGYIVMSGSDAAEPVIAFGPNKMAGIDPEEPLYELLEMASENSDAAENPPVAAPKRTSGAGDAGDDDATSDEIERETAFRRKLRWETFLKGADGPQRAATSTNVIVQPLMPQHWNQWQPYNDYCPRVADDGGHKVYRRRAATGCVATAFAQVMGYYQWPVRMDRVLGYTNSCSSGPFTRVAYRFDGSVPLDWSDLEMEYEWYNYGVWSGDRYDLSRGDYMSEATRYKIARILNLNEVVCQISFGPLSKGSSGYTTSVGNYNPWYRGTSNVSHGSDLAPALKEAMLRGEPCVVAVPSHAVVVHGYAEGNDGTQFAYINYGWGTGSTGNDGWFDINMTTGSGDSHSGYISTACIGFVPYNSVQVDPLPAYSGTSVTLNWHAVDHWKDATTGFQVTASYAGETVSDFVDDFSTAKGTAAGVTRGVASSTGNATAVLGFDGTLESDQSYVYAPVTLTSSSVLSFDFWYYRPDNRKDFYVQASFDGGEWVNLFSRTSGPRLSSGDPSWATQTVNLSAHAGKTALFRIVQKFRSGGYSFYMSGDEGVQVAVDNFKVTNCKAAGETRSATVANTARSHTFTGLTVGKTYSFSVMPIASNAADLGVASTTISTASGSLPSVVQVWADTSSTNQVKEGFFRNCALSGRTVLHVQCSENTAAFEAHSGNWTALPDSAIVVHDVGGGLYDVVFDTSLTTEADDQRLMMTLVATDECGRAGAKNLSLRLLASVPSETYTPSTKTPPTTDGGSVTAILATTATAAVEVTSFGREGSSATVTMSVYRGTSATGTAVSTQNKTLSSLGTASFNLTGLTSGSTYTVRFVTKSSNNMSKTDDVTFTTVLNRAPTIASVTPGTPSSTAAPVTVNLSDLGAGSTSVSLKVEVSTQSNFSSIAKTVTQNNVTATGPTTVTVSGLASATKYYVRVTATGSNGMASTNTSASFTTADPAMPSGSFTLGTATLNTIPVNWSVDSIGTGNSSVVVWVDYGTTTSYGTSEQAGTANGAKTGTYTISGLVPETAYHVRVRVVAGSRTFTCDDRTATTLPIGDPVVSATAGSVSQYAATFTWSLADLGYGASSATVYADVSKSSSFPSGSTTTSTLAADATSTGSSRPGAVSGLDPETTYYVRVRAVNDGGKTGASATMTFATKAVGTPAVAVSVAQRLQRGATLRIVVSDLGETANSATVYVDYGTTMSYGTTKTAGTLSEAGSLDYQITELESETDYCVRVRVVNNGNKTGSATATFKTLEPNDPAFTLDVSTSYSSAFFDATVTRIGEGAASAAGYVRWGSSSALSPELGRAPFGKVTTVPATVRASASGLTAGTTYYYEAVITNNITGRKAATGSFTTQTAGDRPWGQGYYEGGLLMGYASGGQDPTPATTTLSSGTWATKTFARGPIMSYVKCNASTVNAVDGATYSWGQSKTYVYEGQMWMEAGIKYQFAGLFWPGEYLYIDGEEVLAATECSPWAADYGLKITKEFTVPTTGWHDVKIVEWATNHSGGGGAGGGTEQWNSAPDSPFYSSAMGLAWNTNGTKTVESDNVSSWSKLLDAGDRHLFRAKGKQPPMAFLSETPTFGSTTMRVPVSLDTAYDNLTLTVYASRSPDCWYFENRWEKTVVVGSTGAAGAKTLTADFSGIDTSVDWYVSARLADGANYDQWTDPVKFTPVIVRDPPAGSVSVGTPTFSSNTATVNVTSLGDDSTSVAIVLEWSTASDFSSKETAALGAVSAPGSKAKTLSGLAPGTTYYARAVLTGSPSGLSSTTAAASFTTPAYTAPSIASVTAAGTGATKGRVTVNVSSLGQGSGSATISVFLSPDGVFGSTPAATRTISATGSQTFDLAGLSASTAYFVKVVATGSNGKSATDTGGMFATDDRTLEERDWFNVDLSKPGYSSIPHPVNVGDAGTWSGAGAFALVHSAANATLALTLADGAAETSELRYTADGKSAAGCDAEVRGSVVATPHRSLAALPAAPSGALAGLAFVRGSGGLTPCGLCASGWTALSPSVAAGSTVPCRAIFDFSSANQPRVRYAIGSTTNGWLALASGTRLSGVGFRGDQTVGSFRGTYWKVVEELAVKRPAAAVGGTSEGVPAIDPDTGDFRVRVGEMVEGWNYTVFASATIDGPYTAVADSVRATASVLANGLEVPCPPKGDGSTLFVKIVASDGEFSKGDAFPADAQ